MVCGIIRNTMVDPEAPFQSPVGVVISKVWV